MKEGVFMKKKNSNIKFTDSAYLNDATYLDYLERFKRIALSMFEWVNLPKTMNARWLERSLYMYGMAALLKDEKYGFINTNCASSGAVNIYGLPTKLNCYSFEYQSVRELYTGLTADLDSVEDNECILVMNNWEAVPTASTLQLFAYRLYEAQRSCDVNVKASKTPVMVVCDDKQRLTMENLYSQYDGNQPFIFGDSEKFNTDLLKAIRTDAPFIADKLTDYKKEIWNEALSFLGVNNIMLEKKERLVSDEANSNNELINLNLQSFLAPRLEACKLFNEKFGLTGTDKEISVRVRSDLYNVIKKEMSVTTDYINDEEKSLNESKNIEIEGDING